MRPFKMNDVEFKDYLLSIKKVTDKECWVTDKYKTEHGRCAILFRGKKVYLYRLAYQLFKGDIPANSMVMHKCDNPLCFNPDHLQVGTAKDNMMDCVSKGRKKNSKPNYPKHKIKSPYDYEALLTYIKGRIIITDKNEWLYCGKPNTSRNSYPLITINKRTYLIHRLVLANKLGKQYDDLKIASHKLPDGMRPRKNDVNPDHLFEETQSENMQATVAYRKDRKLTPDDLSKITAEVDNAVIRAGGYSAFDRGLADKFNVAQTTIQGIRQSLGEKAIPGKPLIQMDLLGRVISKYSSVINASKILSLKPHSIYRACHKKIVHAGYYWSFEDEKDSFSPAFSQKVSVTVIKSDGSRVKYDSYRDAGRSTGLSSTQIKRLCKNKQETENGRWMLELDFLMEGLIKTSDVDNLNARTIDGK